MKKRMWRSLCSVVLAAVMAASALSLNASAAAVSDFTDVAPESWYYSAVEYAADNGLFAGTSKTTFSPGGAMTRGMFVKVLGSKAGIDKSQYLRYRFTDVKQGDYYAPYVEWAACYGIVNGKTKVRFDPSGKITREQMAAILYRYAKVTENDTDSSGGETALSAFSDAGRVSGYAAEAMGWAVSKGVIKGSAGKLDPQGTATRAQVAQIFLNSKDLLVKTEINAEPILPEDEPDASTDPKAHPNNVYNVFAREFSASNNWKVSSKSRMVSSEQEQLLSLLQGRTGNCVWNDVALEGYRVTSVGETRAEVVHGDNGDYTTKAVSLEKLAGNIEKAVHARSFTSGYFCIALGDYVNSAGQIENKDLYYELYFINEPNAHVNPKDSAFLASVKQKVAERLPSNYVWSEYALGGGWSCVPLLDPNHTTEAEQAEDYADFFVYMLTEGWGKRSGAHYSITLPSAVTSTQLPDSHDGFENLVVWYG